MSVTALSPITRYRCQRCGKWVDTSATPVLRAEDAPDGEPVALGPFELCQPCAFDVYFEHPTIDIRTKKRTSRAQSINKDARVYPHTFAGADVDPGLAGFQVDAHCVAVSALPRTPWGAPGPHPFVYQFEGVANPAVVIRWLIYRPNRDACLLVWWNANKQDVDYELVNLEAG